MAAGTAVPRPGPAVLQRWLCPPALHLLQPDGAAPLPKCSLGQGRHRRATAQLPACHLGIPHVPRVVTHRPPGAAVPHLHSAGAPLLPSHGTNLLPVWRRQRAPRAAGQQAEPCQARGACRGAATCAARGAGARSHWGRGRFWLTPCRGKRCGEGAAAGGRAAESGAQLSSCHPPMAAAEPRSFGGHTLGNVGDPDCSAPKGPWVTEQQEGVHGRDTPQSPGCSLLGPCLEKPLPQPGEAGSPAGNRW